MRAHLLQHVPFEGPGSIGPWLAAAGYEVSLTRLFESPVFPEPGDIDLLIILGGPMSVHDERAFPWLVREKDLIRRCIDSGTPVLGICLGAQLVAQAMGARVYRNPVSEIGWFPVHAVRSGDEARFRFPESVDVFHWHGETFDLPEGATHLARSEGCEHQAFQIGRSVIGLQFHLETTPELAQALVMQCADELVPSAFVRSEHEILSVDAAGYVEINGLMADLLSYLSPGSNA